MFMLPLKQWISEVNGHKTLSLKSALKGTKGSILVIWVKAFQTQIQTEIHVIKLYMVKYEP